MHRGRTTAMTHPGSRYLAISRRMAAARLLVELGESKSELGAADLSRGRPDPAAHGGDEPGADEQADPRAAGHLRGRRGAVEQLEQAASPRRPESRARRRGPGRSPRRRRPRPRSARSTPRRRTSPHSTAGCGRPARHRSGPRSTVASAGPTWSVKVTPGQRASSDVTMRGRRRCRRTGSQPISPASSPNRFSATTSSTSRCSRSASS